MSVPYPGGGESNRAEALRHLKDDSGHEWSKTTGETAVQNLVAVAKALAAGSLPLPISS